MSSLRIYADMFGTFFKIGAFTIGGGYAMIPLIQAEVVDKKQWIPADQFLDLLALAQSAPGILAANTAIFIGYKMKGLKGALITTLGAVLPSFLIILAIALFFADYKDQPAVEAVFKGIRPAVVALIAAPLWKMSRSAHITWKTAIVPIATALLIWLGGWSPIIIIAIALLGGVAYAALKDRDERRAQQ